MKEGAKCRWGRLNVAAVAENWRFSTRSVVNLAQSQVYRLSQVVLEKRPLNGCSSSSGVADSCVEFKVAAVHHVGL